MMEGNDSEFYKYFSYIQNTDVCNVLTKEIFKKAVLLFFFFEKVKN